MIVYLATNTVNGSGYIGQTIADLAVRRAQHEQAALRGVQYPLHHALRKYGFDAFRWRVLAKCQCVEELNCKEMEMIALYETKAPDGYNLTDGGGGTSGWSHSDESKAKIANTHRGKTVTPEARSKISASVKDLWADDEYRAKVVQGQKSRQPANEATRAKLSKASRARWLNENYRNRIVSKMTGRKLAPEHVAKIVQANTGKKRSAETRQRISQAKKGTTFKMTEEAKKKISQTLQGHTVPLATRVKISNKLSGRKCPEHSAKLMGRKQDPEVNKKRAETMKAYWAKRKRQAGCPAATLPS